MRTRFVLGTVVLVAMSACGSSDSGRGGTTDPKTPFTVWVLDAAAPLAGVRVALDPATGERVVKTTEADGHVTFDADFRSGGASVTAFSNDHVYVTVLESSPDAARARPNEAGKPAADLVITPPPLDDLVISRTAGLRGNISGKRDATTVVSLAASSLPRLGAARAFEPSYALRVPKDRDFFLLGHESKMKFEQGVLVDNEILKSFRIDLTARSSDTTLDLDVSKPPSLAARVLRVSAELPREGSFTAARATASTASATSGLVTGLFARSKPAADARSFDVDVTVVDADVGGEPLVSRAVLTALDGAQTVRTELGTQTEGKVWKDFQGVPTFREPDASRAVTDPIVLEAFPADADMVARLYGSEQLFWVIYGRASAVPVTNRTFTIPYDNEVEAVSIQLFSLAVTARRDRLPLPSGAEEYRFTSTSRDIVLRKQ